MLIKTSKNRPKDKPPPETYGGWTGRVVEVVKIPEKKRVRKPVKFAPIPE